MKNNKEFLILSLALIVVMLGFGLVIPVFPFFVEDLGAGGTALGLLVATSAFLEFVFGPLWGGVSDRIGRKPVLLIGLSGYALSAFLFGISTWLWMLFAARALSGVLSSAAITAAMATVSDITPEGSRSEGMGKIGAAMAFGLMLGPGLGGWLARDSLSTPFFIAAGMSVAALALVLVLLPETAQRSRAPAGGKELASQAGNLWKAARGPLGMLFLLVTVFSFALTNFEAIFGLYALQKFGFGPGRVGAVLMVVAVVSTAGKALLTGPVTRKWGERNTIKASLVAGAAGYLVLLLAWDFASILAATAFFILSKTLLRPSALGLISTQSSWGRGTVMGLSNSFMSLGRIIGPIWAGYAFDLNIHLPYISGSAVLLAGFLMSLRVLGVEKTRSGDTKGTLPSNIG